MDRTKLDKDYINKLSTDYFPGHLGIVFTDIQNTILTAEFTVQKHLLAPNEFLHAGSVVSLADTCTGYGCVLNLPEHAVGFTTVELKSNHLGTARSGVVECVAQATHIGKSTQVWDATVRNKASGKTIALFRCTQMILYAKN